MLRHVGSDLIDSVVRLTIDMLSRRRHAITNAQSGVSEERIVVHVHCLILDPANHSRRITLDDDLLYLQLLPSTYDTCPGGIKLHSRDGGSKEMQTPYRKQSGIRPWITNPAPPLMKLVKPIELFQKFLKSGSMEKGRLLGLDVGQKYVGLAVSDTCNKIASPLSVLVRKKTNIDLVARDLQTLVSQLSLVGFVVGYPFSLQGQSSIEAVQVKLFVEDLRKTGRLDGSYFTYWNENYTSKCVQALLDPLKLHPVESKTIIDKFAAVGILQGYLDDMNRNLKSEDMPKE
uniref:Pre-16S rRNA nuclease isoform X2 n=1 Tax=Elaeis guineensis var. tenera TaxID=51953 RepID=A0A8N4I623_ELAGV|nr:putative pre-16S rRNA nuclease isoform X2 [Elaeis guineensis]XP_029117178.1 putative pre-16S rRNA nuclease isoform X2 [Elaeis guineensis]